MYTSWFYVCTAWVCECVFFSSRRRPTICALVTGVQTCALPISRDRRLHVRARPEEIIVLRAVVGIPELAGVDKIADVEHEAVEDAVAAEAVVEFVDQIGKHTSELQSLMRISYAVFCLKQKNKSRRSVRDPRGEHQIASSSHVLRQNDVDKVHV